MRKTIQLNVLKAQDILFTPQEFFKTAKKERGIREALVFLIFITLVGGFFVMIDNLLFGGADMVLSLQLSGWLYIVLNSIIMALTVIPMSFVVTGILHVFIKALKGQGSWRETYKTYIYSGTPYALLSWVPMANIFGLVYSIVLIVIGVEIMHKISRLRAVLALTVLFLAGIIAALLIAFVSRGL